MGKGRGQIAYLVQGVAKSILPGSAFAHVFSRLTKKGTHNMKYIGMTAVVAGLALTGLADITSANVVG